MKKNFIHFILALCLPLLAVSTSARAQGLPPVTSPLYGAAKAATVPHSLAAPTPYVPFSTSTLAAADGCFFNPDESYATLTGGDDHSTGLISLPFTFSLYGTTYTSLYLNNNGNITFGSPFSTYSASGFPTSTPMIAPFWADVDTRVGNLVKYKIEDHKFTATWPGVGYYDQSVLTNPTQIDSFQLIITDGTVSDIGIGNNVAFHYSQMNWTTGTASGGSGGFGGTPATVGINSGDGSHYVQVGRFNLNSSAYTDNVTNAGVHYLEYKCFAFSVADTGNQPPSYSGGPSGNIDTIFCGSSGSYFINWIGPETGQLVNSTLTYLGSACGISISGTSGFSSVSRDTLTVDGSSCNAGMHYFAVQGTDNLGAVTNDTFRIYVSNVSATPITGTDILCAGSTGTLSVSATSGGTWSSSNTAVATVSASGALTGVAAGTAVISFLSTGGCASIKTVTINAAPAAITGGGTACIGATITLSCATTGGSWISGATSVATISGSGVVTGVSAGTSVITYIMSGACAAFKTITINPSPTSITGSLNGCVGITNTFGSTPSGGAWSSGTTAVATINTSGQSTGFTIGTTTISYTLSSGCRTTAVFTVNAVPDSVSGTAVVCAGLTTPFTGYPSGGFWSTGNAAVATVDTTGLVTGVALGTARITYTNAGGCYKIKVVTVNPAPLAITGTANVCVANTTTLACAGGGTWSSSNVAIGSVASTTGVVRGIAAGTVTITYRLSTGCINTRIVTVNAAPTAITGTFNICVGKTTTLNSTPSGGTWTSSGLSVATVGSATGVVYGVAGGVATISYTIAGGCRVTKVVTVNNAPPTIGGTATVAAGGTTTLTNTLTGGSWSSDNTAIAAVGTTGIVSGVAPGTVLISYTSAAGCSVTRTVTVTGSIGAITGTATLCTGNTTTLSCSPTGGVWTSANTTVATVTSGGLVTGVTAGTATISYTISGASATTVVTVYTMPAAITGSGSACMGSSVMLASTTSGGSWSSANTAVATVGTAGDVYGVTTGTATISYAISGVCAVTKVVTVNVTPSAIGGTLATCVGQSTALTCTPTGGAWSSSAPSIANISSGGVATGAAVGSAIISYTLASGCGTTGILNVNDAPSAITGTLAVCAGSSTTLSSATTGGSWSSSNTAVATIDGSGAVTTISSGTTTISYSVDGGCVTTAILTVNPLPLSIGGSLSLCEGATTTLTNSTTGGTWSSSNTTAATIDAATGVVTAIAAGTTTITYSVYTGCITTSVLTVNSIPGTISGGTTLCVGATSSLGCTPSGGSWSSSVPTIATVGSTGVVTGVSAGSSVITYTVGSGCNATTVVSVLPVPAVISGTASVCEGQTTTLTTASTGGSWYSAGTGTATVDAYGVVTGVAAGTIDIVYYFATGCAVSKNITVNALPAAITGTTVICSGSNTALSSATTGGAWSSASPAIATTGTSGVVSGVAAGVATISYTLGTGCTTTTVVTVNQTPVAITGSASLCPGTTTTLSSTTSGGSWSSTDGAVATVDASTGVVSGIAAGTATISYTLGSCAVTKDVTVNTASGTISGGPVVCPAVFTTLSTAATGGTWSSSNTAVGTINSVSGIFIGVTPGTTTVTYTMATGCLLTTDLTVNPAPGTVNGPTTICLGTTQTLTNIVSGGTWSSSNAAVASVNTTGDVTGVSNGTATITYAIGTCTATKQVTVNTAFTSGITFNMCLGSTKTLVDSIPGGTWTSTNTSVATVGAATGIALALSPGMSTITYTLSAGCSKTTPLYVQNSSATISGSTAVCVGSTATFSVPSGSIGGIWTNSNATVANINSSTGVFTALTAGTTTVSYTLVDCITTRVVTVNDVPAAITGARFTCIGSTTTLSNATASGTWSSSNVTVATAGSTTGVISGLVAGTSAISYTVSGCRSTAIVTVAAAPAAITGTANVCVGNTTTLASATAGGTWSSGITSIATIGTTGIVSGIAAGNSTITYGFGGSCQSVKVVTVNPTPGASTGEDVVCAGLTITLSNALTGGAWSSSNTAKATANAATGLITGVAAGTTNITYRTTPGCTTVKTITVNAAPAAITGSNVCLGDATTFTHPDAGGTWSSASTLKATVDAAGLVTGISTGSTTISYTLSAGCYKTKVVVINALPAAITGASSVVVGSSTTLACATSGGTWSSSNTAVGTVGSTTGSVAGISAGTTTISFVVTATGCRSLRSMTVNAPALGRQYLADGNGNSITFAVYPNPTQGTFTVQTSVAGTFRIFTLDGRMTGSYELNTATATIELPADLASGVYMCKFTGNDGSLETVRLIYQK